MSTIASPALSPVARVGAGTATRVLLACGVLSSLVYVAANVMAGLSWPGYSFTSQTISELSAIGAPSRAVWIPFGIAYDLLLLAFGIGVWRSAEGKRHLRVSMRPDSRQTCPPRGSVSSNESTSAPTSRGWQRWASFSCAGKRQTMRGKRRQPRHRARREGPG